MRSDYTFVKVLYLKNFSEWTMRIGIIFTVVSSVLVSCSNRSTETSDTAQAVSASKKFTKFSQWCMAAPFLQSSLDRNVLEAARTVHELMDNAKVSTQKFSMSCLEAEQYLQNAEIIFLDGLGLVNVEPLAVFTKAGALFLENNRITDLSPLKNLRNLRILNIGGNNPSDVKCPFQDESICVRN
jgi:internalin A